MFLSEDKSFSFGFGFAVPTDTFTVRHVMASPAASRTQMFTLSLGSIAGRTHRDTSGLPEIEVIRSSVELVVWMFHNCREIAAPYTSSSI